MPESRGHYPRATPERAVGRFLFCYKSRVAQYELESTDEIMAVREMKLERRNTKQNVGVGEKYRCFGEVFNIDTGKFQGFKSSCFIDYENIPALRPDVIKFIQEQIEALPDKGLANIKCLDIDSLHDKGVGPKQSMPLNILMSTVSKAFKAYKNPIVNQAMTQDSKKNRVPAGLVLGDEEEDRDDKGGGGDASSDDDNDSDHDSDDDDETYKDLHAIDPNVRAKNYVVKKGTTQTVPEQDDPVLTDVWSSSVKIVATAKKKEKPGLRAQQRAVRAQPRDFSGGPVQVYLDPGLAVEAVKKSGRPGLDVLASQVLGAEEEEEGEEEKKRLPDRRAEANEEALKILTDRNIDRLKSEDLRYAARRMRRMIDEEQFSKKKGEEEKVIGRGWNAKQQQEKNYFYRFLYLDNPGDLGKKKSNDVATDGKKLDSDFIQGHMRKFPLYEAKRKFQRLVDDEAAELAKRRKKGGTKCDSDICTLLWKEARRAHRDLRAMYPAPKGKGGRSKG